MPDATWKKAERAVARVLGGERTSRRGLGEAVADVETKAFSVEVKTRRQLPAWLMDAVRQAVRNTSDGKLTLLVLHVVGQRHDNDLVVLRLQDFVDWFGEVPDEEAW